MESTFYQRSILFMKYPICSLPFNHMFSDNSGYYKLCCHTEARDSFKKDWNMQEHDPFEFFYSDEMEEVRRKMLSGEYVSDCSVCYKKDNLGIISDRFKHTDKKNWEYSPRDKLKRTMELKLTLWGNYCNLSCAMCHPVHSSARTKELKELQHKFDTSQFHWKSAKSKITSKRYQEILDDVICHIDLVDCIVISSDGEPLLNAKMYEFIAAIPDADAKQISLTITTNLSNTEFLTHSLDDIIDKFPNTKLRVSCDHIKDKYNWIRYPGDFDRLIKNIEKYSKYIQCISPAVNLLNVDDLVGIKTFFNDMNLNCLDAGSYSVVRSPSMISCIMHKNKQELIEKYKKYEWASPVLFELQGDKKYMEDDIKNAIKYLDALSEKRGNWRTMWNVI